jgi:hypothetical protein
LPVIPQTVDAIPSELDNALIAGRDEQTRPGLAERAWQWVEDLSLTATTAEVAAPSRSS